MLPSRVRPLGFSILGPGLLTVVLVLAGVAQAEEKPSTATTSSSPGMAASSPSSISDVGITERRDPAGLSGLSPFAEAILRGDAAYLARNFSGAEQEYRAAIQLSPQDARGHLRLAAAAFALARPDDALASADAALRFAGPDAKLRSDALRFMALVVEQTGALDRAIEAWNRFAVGDAKVPRKVAPPVDISSQHIARLEARQAALVEGNRVRERIARELAGEPAVPVSQVSSASK